MTLDAASLIEGPRGRRLVLAAALEAFRGRRGEWLLSPSLQALADEADRDASAGLVAAAWLSSDDSPYASPRRLSIENVAELLADAPVDDLPDLLPALEETVRAARGWQPPDAEDLLTSDPVLLAALTRLASMFVDRSEVASWDTPLDRSTQWMVDFDWDGSGDVEAFPGTLAQKRLDPDWDRWGSETTEEEVRAQRELDADAGYELSGSWWSPPVGIARATTRELGDRGPVGLHLVEDSSGWRYARATPVLVDAAAAVYEVDLPEAWAELCRRYPSRVTASRSHVWFLATGRKGEWVLPDWAAVAEHHDGVHLSVAGYLRAAGAVIPVDGETASLIAGWGPDETWWLRGDHVRLGEAESREWQQSDDGEWRRR